MKNIPVCYNVQGLLSSVIKWRYFNTMTSLRSILLPFIFKNDYRHPLILSKGYLFSFDFVDERQ